MAVSRLTAELFSAASHMGWFHGKSECCHKQRGKGAEDEELFSRSPSIF